jgi:hypothetical protein
LTVHSRLARLLCSDRRSAGRAVVTTSASRKAIINAKEAATRVHAGFQVGRRGELRVAMGGSFLAGSCGTGWHLGAGKLR